MGVQVRLPRLICAKIMSKQENKTGTKLYSIFALFPLASLTVVYLSLRLLLGANTFLLAILSS